MVDDTDDTLDPDAVAAFAKAFVEAKQSRDVMAILVTIMFTLLNRGPVVVNYDEAMAVEENGSPMRRLTIAVDKTAGTVTAMLLPSESAVVAQPEGVQ